MLHSAIYTGRGPLVAFCILYLFYFSTASTLRVSVQHAIGLDETDQPLLAHAGANTMPLRLQKEKRSFEQMLDALNILQTDYFQVWTGMWPSAIDWTSAVMSTHLSAAMTTVSRAMKYEIRSSYDAFPLDENSINHYFDQLVAFYFGQNAFELRTQAYDDMLWVVLGWLEGIKLINVHTELHYGAAINGSTKGWHGKQWIPAFAHRARIFWELASKGWDTSLCGGGMLWSPHTSPYKNAITNELYIAASISMYLHFPGDSNGSPFMSVYEFESTNTLPNNTQLAKPQSSRDPKYLQAAVEGYIWLVQSNMTNQQGLYEDGFHVSGYNGSPNTHPAPEAAKCDLPSTMIYTYNQGVLLTGQRGLYEATAARSYLEDGHRLIKDVINATGYDLSHDRPREDRSNFSLPIYQGIGRAGIMEDWCDSRGDCSQDGQTFKGVFFHHLTTFCESLTNYLLISTSGSVHNESSVETSKWHAQKCAGYKGWIHLNAQGALNSRNNNGKYGMWWGAGNMQPGRPALKESLSRGAVDYKNSVVPIKPESPNPLVDQRHGGVVPDLPLPGVTDQQHGVILSNAKALGTLDQQNGETLQDLLPVRDPNDRGRGRTVETQGGGVAVMRALWDLIESSPTT